MTGQNAARPPTVRLVGGLLLWFAVLGGAVAWAVHLFAAWGIEELVCSTGHEQVAGVPLDTAIAIACGLPGAVTLAALATSVVAWRRIRRGDERIPPERLSRARLLAVVGVWSNLLFVAIIAFDTVALVVIPVCQS